MQEPNDNAINQKSKINSAFLELTRIHGLFLKCHEYRQKGNLTKWNEQLDSIWSELAGEYDPFQKEKKDYFKKMKDLNDLIAKSSHNRRRLNQILITKQIFLKYLQNQQGKGSSYIDEDEDSFE